MKFVLVNGRTPRPNLSVPYAVRQRGKVTSENLQRGSPTAITSTTSVTAKLPSQRFKGLRGRHDNHRRFQVPAANGSRPIADGGLCGAKRQNSFALANGFALRATVGGAATNDKVLLVEPQALTEAQRELAPQTR